MSGLTSGVPVVGGASEGPSPEGDQGKEPEVKRPVEEGSESEVPIPGFTQEPEEDVLKGMDPRELRALKYVPPDLSEVEKLAARERPDPVPREDPLADLPNIVPLKRVAALFGVDVRTARRWVRAGRLKCFRTSPRGSGRVLFEKSELRRFWNSLRQPPPPGATGGAP